MLLDRIGNIIGADQSSLNGHGYLDEYEKLINSELANIDTLVVLGHKNSYKLAAAIATVYETINVKLLQFAAPTEPTVDIRKIPNLTVYDVDTVEHADEVLTTFSPVQLLIEDGTNKRLDKIASFENLFWHIQKDGHYVVEDLHAVSIPALAQGSEEDILSEIYVLGNDKRYPPNLRKLTGSAAERRDSIYSFTVVDKLLVIKKNFTHFRKTSEDSYRLKHHQQRLGTHIQRVEVEQDAGTFTSRAEFFINRAELANRTYTEISYPSSEWRVYEDVRVDPFSVVTAAGTFLPETFRLFRKPYLSSFRISDASVNFGRAPKGAANSELHGTYYHLDNEFIDQFGHMTTDVLSKVWAYSIAKSKYPDLKALLSVAGETEVTSLKPWVLPFLNAAGIPTEDIVLINEPTQVERLIAATPLFSNLSHVNPSIASTWNKVRENLAGVDTALLPKRKIFVGRSNAYSRGCQNSVVVEEWFTHNGFEVIYPETMTYSEQAKAFASASAVAGYAGSAMINTFMCQNNVPKLIIASETYAATNEALISSVIGGRVQYIYCDSDIQHPNNSWSLAAHKSNYSFNVERDEKHIEKWLKEIAN